jgi:hypothetical protein
MILAARSISGSGPELEDTGMSLDAAKKVRLRRARDTRNRVE